MRAWGARKSRTSPVITWPPAGSLSPGHGYGPVLEMDETTWRDTFAINLDGPFFASQTAASAALASINTAMDSVSNYLADVGQFVLRLNALLLCFCF